MKTLVWVDKRVAGIHGSLVELVVYFLQIGGVASNVQAVGMWSLVTSHPTRFILLIMYLFNYFSLLHVYFCISV